MMRGGLRGRNAFDLLRTWSLDRLRGGAPNEGSDADANRDKPPPLLTTLGALTAITVVGWTVSTTNSTALTVGVAILLLPGLWLVHWLRFPFVIIGGLTILYSSNSLDGAKVLYLTGMAVVCAIAVLRLRNLRATPMYVHIRPLLLWSAVWFAVICLSAIVGVAHRHAWVDILRDAAPYVLICSVPLIVYDNYDQLRGYGSGLFVAAGVAAALSFTAFVLVRRSVALPFDHLVLPSALLPASLFCFAVSKAFRHSDRRLLWVAVAAIVLIALLASGTRTYLVLIVGPLVLVLLETATWRQLIKVGGVSTAFGVLIIGGFYGIRGLAGLHGSTVLDRFWSLPHFVSNPTADWSFEERLLETKIAFDAFAARPLLGAGLGERFAWRLQTGQTEVAFYLDTTVAYAAKFGVVGILVLLGVGWTWIKLTTGLLRTGGRVAASALVAYLVVTVCLFPLGSPLEDKGFSFGLMFLLSLALAAGGQDLVGAKDAGAAHP